MPITSRLYTTSLFDTGPVLPELFSVEIDYHTQYLTCSVGNEIKAIQLQFEITHVLENVLGGYDKEGTEC